MLEIYITDGLTETDVKQLVDWSEDLGLPTEVREAPLVPGKHLSTWVQASHEAAGIWHLPLFEGHVRILMAKRMGTGPRGRVGCAQGRRMMAAHMDVDFLNVVALHELGHVFDATLRRDIMLKLKHGEEVRAQEEIASLIQSLSSADASKDGVVDYQGLHCLNPNCIMQYQALLPSQCKYQEVRNLFCDHCLPKVTRKLRATLKKKVKAICGDCCYLERCMIKDDSVWERAAACSKYDGPLYDDPLAPRNVSDTPNYTPEDEKWLEANQNGDVFLKTDVVGFKPVFQGLNEETVGNTFGDATSVTEGSNESE